MATTRHNRIAPPRRQWCDRVLHSRETVQLVNALPNRATRLSLRCRYVSGSDPRNEAHASPGSPETCMLMRLQPDDVLSVGLSRHLD
jgi:hypothetical protein